MQNLPNENEKRFISILNKKIETWKLFNALWHMTAWLTGWCWEKFKEMCFLEYKDKDNWIHPNISHYPFIVLKADNWNKIRRVREEAIKRWILFSDFTSTMTVWTSEDQVNKTSETLEQDLEYYWITLFWWTDELREFTGKFSLYN